MPRFGALNKRFHLAIYEACPYRLLLEFIEKREADEAARLIDEHKTRARRLFLATL
jgi:DNA-binding GntR family transcriptional regulator